ncbi:MAG: hypothetical protein RLN88_06780 [Ekhidna sp.]|uniref:hypothetical protein n=1 Tax=Ekhidna sp. TaxID=2608089 RepID=UPI0032EB9FD3
MQEGRGKHWVLIVALLCSLHLSAQEVSVRGGFVEDSLLIGQDVNFWMAATYPPEMEMVFPDSLYSFAPFEFSDKTYFPTKVKNGLAYDSTVYIIQSFEIDQVQYLWLPAIILNNRDTTIINTPLDSIFLTELAPVVSDTTKLKTNVDYQTVERTFNYPLLYYILGGLILIIIILLLIFGKQIIKWFKLRRLRIQFEQFDVIFSDYVKKLKVDPDPELAERALVFWKSYQQRLEKLPFSVLTSKEILGYDFAGELEKPLKSIDRVVYGKRVDENIFQDFLQIENFTQHRYSKKVEEIKDGK